LVGEFKDDCLQTFSVILASRTSATSGTGKAMEGVGGGEGALACDILSARFGNTTHGKQKGIKYIIKVL
jgi:hypothetical protein